jgi:hypothetical protein
MFIANMKTTEIPVQSCNGQKIPVWPFSDQKILVWSCCGQKIPVWSCSGQRILEISIFCRLLGKSLQNLDNLTTARKSSHGIEKRTQIEKSSSTRK